MDNLPLVLYLVGVGCSYPLCFIALLVDNMKEMDITLEAIRDYLLFSLVFAVTWPWVFIIIFFHFINNIWLKYKNVNIIKRRD